MTKLSRAALDQLLKETPIEPEITMYVPVHSAQSPPHISADEIRYKNLHNRVRHVIDNLQETIDSKSHKAIKQQFQQFDKDEIFLEHPGKGFVVLMNPKGVHVFDLPIDCDEYVAVDNHFHVAPLLGLAPELIHYYVLALSQREPKLFLGDMYGLQASDIALPISGTDTRHYVHVSRAGSKSQPENFGASFPLISEEERKQFFRAVDRILRNQLDTKSPILLAGSLPDVDLYRSISSYPSLLSQHVATPQAGANPHDLFPPVQTLVYHEIIDKRRSETLERYTRLAGETPERVSDELPSIQDALDKGRVDTLLLTLIRQTADTVRDNRTDVPKLHFPIDEQMNVLNTAALQTWRDHGNIVLIDDASPAPPNSAISAIFRY